MLTETSALTVDARSRRLRKVSAVVVMVLKLLKFDRGFILYRRCWTTATPCVIISILFLCYVTVPRLRSLTLTILKLSLRTIKIVEGYSYDGCNRELQYSQYTG